MNKEKKNSSYEEKSNFNELHDLFSKDRTYNPFESDESNSQLNSSINNDLNLNTRERDVFEEKLFNLNEGEPDKILLKEGLNESEPISQNNILNNKDIISTDKQNPINNLNNIIYNRLESNGKFTQEIINLDENTPDNYLNDIHQLILIYKRNNDKMSQKKYRDNFIYNNMIIIKRYFLASIIEFINNLLNDMRRNENEIRNIEEIPELQLVKLSYDFNIKLIDKETMTKLFITQFKEIFRTGVQGNSYNDMKISKGDSTHNRKIIKFIETYVNDEDIHDIMNSTFIERFESFFNDINNKNNYFNYLRERICKPENDFETLKKIHEKLLEIFETYFIRRHGKEKKKKVLFKVTKITTMLNKKHK